MNKKLLGIIYPISILAFVLFIYFALVVALFYLNTDIAFGSAPAIIFSSIYLLIFHILAGLILYCYLVVMFTNPGEPPLFWGFNDRPEERKRRYCGICNKFKPERCHHCSTCGRCVLVMDHHCPWLNNCVGLRNRKHFMLLIIYAAVLDGLAIICSLYPLIALALAIARGEKGHLWIFTVGVIGFVLALVFAYIIAQFLSYHFDLVRRNMTTIEHLDEKRGNVREFNYDGGTEFNWQQVFGKKPGCYFLPCNADDKDSQADGTVFMKQRSGVQELGDTESQYQEDYGAD